MAILLAFAFSDKSQPPFVRTPGIGYFLFMPIKPLRRKKHPAPPRTEQHEHLVAGRTLPLKVVRDARARRLTLRVDPAGQGLRVTIPPDVDHAEVGRFLTRHKDWLEQKLAKAPENPQIRPGVKIPLHGAPHLIVHAPDARGTVQACSHEGEHQLIVYGDLRHLPRRIVDFLKREAKRDITQLVEKHSASVGKKAKVIRFKDTSSRWGSCSVDGNLNFSWRIMMAPRPVINYLVAHEVAHLREMNHGPRFWALCEELCPDTKRCRDWLKRNGSALQAIRFDNA